MKSSLKRLPGALEKVLEKKEAEREEKRLVEKLEKSARQMLTIFESITDAFFAVDSSWQLMYLNPRSDLILSKVNKRREEMFGKNWWQEFPSFREAPGSLALEKAMAEHVARSVRRLLSSIRFVALCTGISCGGWSVDLSAGYFRTQTQ